MGILSSQLPAAAHASFCFPVLTPTVKEYFLVLSYTQMGISLLLNRTLKLDKVVEKKNFLYVIVFRKNPELSRELTR